MPDRRDLLDPVPVDDGVSQEDDTGREGLDGVAKAARVRLVPPPVSVEVDRSLVVRMHQGGPELRRPPVDPGRAGVIRRGEVICEGVRQGVREVAKVQLEEAQRHEEARRTDEQR